MVYWSMHRYVVFNWKLNPSSRDEAEKLMQTTIKASQGVQLTTVVACPPLQYVFGFGLDVSRSVHMGLGAQDCFWEDAGAYTGEVSPLALKQSGISYVILGHSERPLAGETDEMVSKKITKALESGLTPIVCFGEDAQTHERGPRAVEKSLAGQLEARLGKLALLPLHQRMRVIATYEPVWAISGHSGNIADAPSDSRDRIGWVKTAVQRICNLEQSLEVLYGGSVNANNIKAFCQEPIIDGFLVGHASLNPAEVRTIIETAEAY